MDRDLNLFAGEVSRERKRKRIRVRKNEWCGMEEVLAAWPAAFTATSGTNGVAATVISRRIRQCEVMP